MQYAAAAAAAAARMDMFGGQALNNGNGSQPQHHHHHHDGLPPLPPLAYMGMPMPPLPPMPGMFDPRTMDMARMMDHSMQSKAVASMMKDNTSAMSAPRHDFNHGLLPPPPSQPQPQPQPQQQQPPPPQQAQTMHPENNEAAAQQQLPGGASLPMSMVGQSAVDNAAVQTKAVTPIMKNASAPAADRTKPGSTSKAPSPQSMDYEGGGEETAPTTTANNSNSSTVTSNPYICWCPICGEKFETFQKLGEHQQVHANHGVGPTPSPHGGEAPPPTTTAAVAAPATHGPYLRQHQMLYPDAMAIAKPFRCHDCGKHFTQIAHLNVHMRIHRNEKPYECTICKKAFTQFSHLKAHERIHTGEKPYKCQHCGKQFKQSQQLQTHVRVHTGERPYSCSICGKGFAQSPHLQTHIRLHTGERPYKCNVCNKQFTQSQHLRAHQRTHGIDKPHVCEICNETFTYAMSLVTHMQSVHQMINRRTYECSMCGKKFHQKHLLENHMTLHTGLGPYKCDQCSMEFADMEDLVGHMKQHVDAAAAIAAATAAATAAAASQMPIRPTMSTPLIANAKANAGKEDTMNRHQPSLSTLECVKPKVELHTMQCGRGMDQIRPEYKSLQPIPSQEMDMKQGNLPPVASMSACFPGFPNQPLAGLSAIEAPAALRSAIEEEIAKINSQPLDQGRLVIADGANQSRRSPIRPYKCDVCDKAFTQQTNLTMHKRIHTGERPYSCTLCDKHFTQSQHLYMHMRIHTGEKPHRCRFCRKEFTRIETLHAHERVHTGEKPFCCQYCQKTFRQSQQLKTHERVHTGERPYKCDYCGKGFAQSSHLRSHNRIHTGERPYKCNMCSKEFKQSTHLMSHRRGHLARDPSLLAVFDKSREEIQALRAQNQLPQEDKMDDEEMLMCTECGDEFFDQRELEEHQKTHVKEKSNVGPNGSPHRGSESPSSVKNDNLDSLSTRSSSPAASESSHESESEESTNNISDHADSDTEDEDEQKSAASNSSSEDEGRMGANRAPKSATTAVPQFNNDMNNGTLDPQGQNPGSSKFKVSVNSEFLEQNNTPSVQYNPGALDKWYVQNRTENDS